MKLVWDDILGGTLCITLSSSPIRRLQTKCTKEALVTVQKRETEKKSNIFQFFFEKNLRADDHLIPKKNHHTKSVHPSTPL